MVRSEGIEELVYQLQKEMWIIMGLLLILLFGMIAKRHSGGV